MTTYIKLEDVQKMLKRWEHLDYTLGALEEDIDSIPTINPESIIIEEIKKYEDYKKTGFIPSKYGCGVILLQELLQKFKS